LNQDNNYVPSSEGKVNADTYAFGLPIFLGAKANHLLRSATMLKYHQSKHYQSTIVVPSPQRRPRKAFANVESTPAIVPPFPTAAMAR
jgi:hypothetical protein